MTGTVRTDAERYRYLRDHCSTAGPIGEGAPFCVVFFKGQGDDLNAAIDAALEPVVPDEPAAPVHVQDGSVARFKADFLKAKEREVRRITLMTLKGIPDGRANVGILAEVLDSYGGILTSPDRNDVYRDMERDGIVQIERCYQQPAILCLTEKGRTAE